VEHKAKPGRGHAPNSRKNLKPIQKGQVLNPIGGQAHDKEKKALRQFTNEYLKEIIHLSTMGKLSDLADIYNAPNDHPAIKVSLAKAVYDASLNGRWDIMQGIVSWIVGKVPDRIDHTTNGESLNPGFIIEFVEPEKK